MNDSMRIAALVVLLGGVAADRAVAATAACAPAKLGEIAFGDQADDIALAGNAIYAAGGDLVKVQGITLNFAGVDISNRSAPRQSGVLGIAGFGSIESMEIAGNVAYVVSEDGLSLIDITNPGLPQHITRITLPVFARRATVENQRAYVIGVGGGFAPDGLVIVDVGAPAVPVQLGMYQRASGEPSRFNWRDIAVAGDVAYIGTPDSILVLDVGNPAAPQPLARFTDPTIGNYPRVVAHGTTLLAIGGGASSGWGTSLLAFDVADPRAPRLLSKIDVGGTGAQDLEVLGNRAIVLDAKGGKLLFYDITAPRNIKLVGTLPVPNGPYQFTAAAQTAAVLMWSTRSVGLWDIAPCMATPGRRRAVN